MATPTYANILLQLTIQIDELTNTFIFKGYDALAKALAKPLASLCVLYIVLTGYAIARGLIKTPLQEFSKGIFRIGLIYLFAMNWSFFSSHAVNLFSDGASELSGVLMQIAHFDNPVSKGGVNNGLQSVLNEVIRVGAWTWDKASFKHWGPIFTAIMIYASGIAVIGLALFELIIAKLMLAICLSTAPLFICFTLFQQTKSFFDRWLGNVVGFSLVLVMVSSVVGLCMHLIHWTISGHYSTHAANISATDWIPILLVSVLCVMAILEVTGLAKSIGGAFSSSNGSAMVGGFMGGVMGASSPSQSILQKGLSLVKMAVPGGMLANLNQIKGAVSSKGANNMSNIRNQQQGQS